MYPWTPIRSEFENNKATIKVWGREYEFNNSFLPASITTAECSILKGPIELNAFFGSTKGVWTMQKSFLIEETEEKVVFMSSQTTENIIINARAVIEYDGFVQISFSVIPFWSFAGKGLNVPKLDKLYLDIPLKREFASLFHYWPNDKTSIIPSPSIINSGALPEEGLVLPFKPYVWAGWEYGGLGICMDTDKNIELDDSERAIEYIISDDEARIRIHLLDHMPEKWQGRQDRWVDTLKPVDFRLGIQATPVKPVPKDFIDYWHVYHVGWEEMVYPNEQVNPDGSSMLERIKAHGVNWLIFHEHWSIIQNYGLPENENRFKKLVQDCHSLGIKVMVYFGYEYSTMEPHWFEKADEYLIKTVDGEYTGGWQRPPMQRDFMVCYKGGYSDEMLARIEFVMDEYGVDGIYTDGTYVPWECANEMHGCGFRDGHGKLHTTFPLFEVRSHVKKMYEIVHKRGGLIDTHQSSCCIMPTLSFCDSYLDGENIQSQFMAVMDEFLKPDAFKAEYMGKNLGIPAQFIAYTNPPEYTIQKIAGITLLHDVHPRAMRGMEDLEYVSAIWNIYNSFGTGTARWYPYWDKACPVKVKGKGIYCSVYEKEDRLLAVVVNFNKDITEAELTMDCRYTTGINALNSADYTINEGAVSIAVRLYEAELLIIE